MREKVPKSTFVQETFTQCSNASRSVYSIPEDAGLLFNDGLGSELTDYTVSLWFKLENYTNDGWARLLDVKNGTVDNGIYRNGDDLFFIPMEQWGAVFLPEVTINTLRSAETEPPHKLRSISMEHSQRPMMTAAMITTL